jgi:hypothetical protein
MLSKMHASLAALAVLSATAIAQQSVWGQCGGQGWSGSTTCASGTTCVKVNDYYYQCQPGIASTSTTSRTTAPTTTSTTQVTTSRTSSTTDAGQTTTATTRSLTTLTTSATTAAAPSGTGHLLVSHFSGSLFALDFQQNGNSGSLTQKQQTNGCGNMPTWLELNSSSSTVYCADESSNNSPKLSALTVSSDGTVKLASQASCSGADVHAGLFGNGFLALSEYDPGTLSVYSTSLSSSSQALSKTKFTISQQGPNKSRQSRYVCVWWPTRSASDTSQRPPSFGHCRSLWPIFGSSRSRW